MRNRTSQTLGLLIVMAVGIWFVSGASAQRGRAVDKALEHFNANRGAYGLTNPSTELRLRRERADEQGVTHVKFDQLYRGLPVFEGEAIAHVDADDTVTVTNALVPNLNVDTTARVGRNDAVNTAVRFIGPLGAYEVRDVSLWILPRGERSIVDRLAWHVAVAVENEFQDPAEWRYFVDASTGAVGFAYDAIETQGRGHGGGGGGGSTPNAVDGWGRTMYSGTQAITVDLQAATYFLRDPDRGTGNYTCDMNNKQISCTTFSRSSDIFGNFLKDNTDRATAGADAHFGLQATWDYYANMFGRNGIDDNNRKTYSRVHYARNYQNAFWSDSCFCMTYGDGGSTFYPLVSVDVAGHEMSHGVMSSEADLTYSGESGGLNESNSDIFGTLVEFSVGSSPDAPDYWIGERIYKSNYSSDGATYTQTKALRYMDDPHRDGSSPACWSSTLKNLDVHYSSGPNNYMFYLLAEGGSSKCGGPSVTGIGQAKAAQIWYDAITNQMTSSTNYQGARAAALAAALARYGNGSTEYNAVATAFSAINVN